MTKPPELTLVEPVGHSGTLLEDSDKPKTAVVLALDPGFLQTAFVVLGPTGNPYSYGIVPNDTLLTSLGTVDTIDAAEVHPVIEMIASYGMAVGKEVFETCVWIGRFYQVLADTVEREPVLMLRREVKLHLCESGKAKDSNIRAALIDLYGGSNRAAIGLKKSPGPLYGFSKDLWAALAVARTYRDKYLVAPF